MSSQRHIPWNPDLTSFHGVDKEDPDWTRLNYLSSSALQKAEDVRAGLERIMRDNDIPLTSCTHMTLPERREHILRALVCGYFTQVAYKDKSRSGGYEIVKHQQVRAHAKSSGLYTK